MKNTLEVIIKMLKASEEYENADGWVADYFDEYGQMPTRHEYSRKEIIKYIEGLLLTCE